jgi:hypothetical protein
MNKVKIYMHVPCEFKRQAKLLNAIWDKSKRCWYFSTDDQAKMFTLFMIEKNKNDIGA